MGHSVGTYIAMEVIRRHRERSTSDHSNTGGFDIIGGVMLFPTVMDIASSPSGKKLTVRLPPVSQGDNFPLNNGLMLKNKNIDPVINHPPPRISSLRLRPYPHHPPT